MQAILRPGTDVTVTESAALGGGTYHGTIVGFNEDKTRYLVRREVAPNLFNTVYALPNWVRAVDPGELSPPAAARPLYQGVHVSVHDGQVLLSSDEGTPLVALRPELAMNLAIGIQQACGSILYQAAARQADHG